jgi:hypothetical protein
MNIFLTTKHLQQNILIFNDLHLFLENNRLFLFQAIKSPSRKNLPQRTANKTITRKDLTYKKALT